MNYDKKICRYCLEDSTTLNLIAPCMCSGSIKYVHEECILRFLNSKFDTYNWSSEICCELCHTELSVIITENSNYSCLTKTRLCFSFFISSLCILGTIFLSGLICDSVNSGSCFLETENRFASILFSGFCIVEFSQLVCYIWIHCRNPALSEFMNVYTYKRFERSKWLPLLQLVYTIVCILFFYSVVCLYNATKDIRHTKRITGVFPLRNEV